MFIGGRQKKKKRKEQEATDKHQWPKNNKGRSIHSYKSLLNVKLIKKFKGFFPTFKLYLLLNSTFIKTGQLAIKPNLLLNFPALCSVLLTIYGMM